MGRTSRIVVAGSYRHLFGSLLFLPTHQPWGRLAGIIVWPSLLCILATIRWDHLAQVALFALGNALFLGVRDGLVALFLLGLAPCAIASLPRASPSPE